MGLEVVFQCNDRRVGVNDPIVIVIGLVTCLKPLVNEVAKSVVWNHG